MFKKVEMSSDFDNNIVLKYYSKYQILHIKLYNLHILYTNKYILNIIYHNFFLCLSYEKSWKLSYKARSQT